MQEIDWHTFKIDDIPETKVKFQGKTTVTIPHKMASWILKGILLHLTTSKTISLKIVQEMCETAFLKSILNYENIDFES